MIATKSDSSEGGLKPAAWLEGVLQIYGMGKEMWEGENPTNTSATFGRVGIRLSVPIH